MSSEKQAPFSQADFAVNNYYSGKYEHGWVIAYAGASVTDNADMTVTDHGARLRVYEGSGSDPGSVSSDTPGQVLIPGTTGSATITAADATTITVSLTDGSTHTLNLLTNTW